MTVTAHRNTPVADAVASPTLPADGPAVQDAATGPAGVGEAVLAGAGRVAAALTGRGGPVDRDGWLALAGSCQELINTVTAVQDTALAQAARRESTWCQDGTLGEVVHAPGRVTLDAADLAAPLLGATHHQAQRRVELAVRLAANKVPVPAEVTDPPETSGLGGLHTAMTDGTLDGYRASVVAFELDYAPADVAHAVITALTPHLGQDCTALRQRTRRLIARISPDLLRQRAQRARANTGLRRWVTEPGVDTWLGTFPSEDAATAWAAIDQHAHHLLTAGTCTSIEQARGKALTDLVTGNATIDVQIVLTVPADTTPTDTPTPPTPLAPPPQELSGPTTSSRAGRALSSRRHHQHCPPSAFRAGYRPALTVAADPPDKAGDNAAARVAASTAPCRWVSGPRRLARRRDAPTGVRRPTPHLERAPRADRGTTATADRHRGAHRRRQDTDTPCQRDPLRTHDRLPSRAPPSRPVPALPRSVNDDALVQVHGARPSEPLLVRRGWLRDHLTKQPPRPPGRRRKAVEPVRAV